MKKRLSILALVSVTVCGAMAADTWLVDVSALDMWLGKPSEVAALRLAIPAGSNPTVYGVDLGFWGQSDRAWGVQINLLLNEVNEKMGGAQIAGCNLAAEATGVQLGLWNSAVTLSGIQFGVLNSAETADFLQFGLGNYATTMKGLQIGGWNNAPNFAGVQLALFNMSQSVVGYQVGLINKTDKMQGFQVGLINVITSSALPVFPIFNCVF
jgi:hypothetical protein